MAPAKENPFGSGTKGILHTPAPTGGLAGHTRWRWVRSGRGHTRSDKAGRMAKSQTRYHQRLQHGVRPCGLDTDSAVHLVTGSTTRVFFPSHRSFLLVDECTFLVKTASLGDDMPVRDSRHLREQRLASSSGQSKFTKFLASTQDSPKQKSATVLQKERCRYANRSKKTQVQPQCQKTVVIWSHNASSSSSRHFPTQQ